jgi:hypothetical protein
MAEAEYESLYRLIRGRSVVLDRMDTCIRRFKSATRGEGYRQQAHSQLAFLRMNHLVERWGVRCNKQVFVQFSALI